MPTVARLRPDWTEWAVWEAEAAALPGEDGSLDWGRRWWEAVGGLERGGLLGSVSADIYKGSGGLRTSQVTP